ncbi:MAG: phosphoenolpyruvate--protein phosphotransferase [Spirochaetota bacterium]
MISSAEIIYGEGIVDGIILDKAIVSSPEKIAISKRRISEEEIKGEILRYKRALQAVRKRLENDSRRLLNELGSEEANIIKSHLLITKDPFFTDEVPLLISSRRRNAEWIIIDGVKSFLKNFLSIDNIYLKERGRDIEDVSIRIIKSLSGKRRSDFLKNLQGILVVKEFVPSMITSIDTKKITGLISEMGNETSHATILAKSLGIPVVINARGATSRIETGEFIILDGNTGQVILKPSKNVVEEYHKIRDEYNKYLKTLEKTLELPAVTQDGVRIRLLANIDIITSSDIALKYGAEGVGLYRTELPFILQNRLLGEEEQLLNYKTLLRSFKERPVTIRTLDIGGDKFLPLQESLPIMEANPFLGLRSIRISLNHPSSFRLQIRALLRASVFGRLSILIPMISSYEEMEKVRVLFDEEKEKLKRENIPFDDSIKIGAMIEIPSAAVSSDNLIELCDFFSLGTNDLVQYTLAVDRTNERVASYYIPENPSVLKLIEITAATAIRHGKYCAVCGELAGNPLFTPFFIGTGISELSMEAKFIPLIKRTIRSFSITEAKNLVEEIQGFKRVKDIKECLTSFYKTHLPAS